MAEQTVESVMTRDVVSVQPSTSVSEIVKLLLDYRISAVPVLGEDGKVLGVVSEADVTAATGRAGLIAANLMNRPALTVRPTEPIPAAARRMLAEGIRRLFVVDPNGTLIGVVARQDLLTPFTRPDNEIRRDNLRDD